MTYALALLPPAAVAAEVTTGTATEEVALRAEPEDDAEALIMIPAGVSVAIVGEARDGYYPVTYADLNGWVATGYLAVNSSRDALRAASEAATEGAGTAITTEELNLREEPSVDAAVATVIPTDAVVILTGRQAGDFLEVTYEGAAGWVLREYLAAEGGPPPAPAARPARPPRSPRSGGPAPTSSSGPIPPPRGYFERAPGPSRATRSANFTEEEIVRIINEAADRYGQSRRDMLRVATCESQLYIFAVGRYGERGIFQFMPSTFASTPYAEYDIYDPWANANAAGWMWSVGRRNEWVCQ